MVRRVIGSMKVGGYTLDLYCDTEGCNAVVKHLIQDRFAGPTKGACIRQAKRNGWHVGYKHQFCPCCAGNAVYESDLTRALTVEELMALPKTDRQEQEVEWGNSDGNS